MKQYNFTTDLLTWYHCHKRMLPWRSTPTPYRVWISEIMLQQTQIATVIPYFERFMTRFPTVAELATAPESDVLKAWEGLGYYSRSRNMQKAAKTIVNQYNSTLPDSYESLQTLPGIGGYTAAAIASIAFGQPVPVVDGNVLRVFCRYWGIADDIRNHKVKDLLFQKLLPIIETSDSPSDFNQAIMELGALVCKPKSPQCSSCPLQANCIAFCENRTNELPYKSPSKKVPHYIIAVAVMSRDGELLISQRKPEGMLANLWELPGGKANSAKSAATDLPPIIRQETNYTISVKQKLFSVKHAFSHFKITIHVFETSITSGKLKQDTSQPYTWVSINNLGNYPFPTANKKIINRLIKEKYHEHKQT